MEKLTCPYCDVELQDDSGIDTEVIRCFEDGEIFCTDCLPDHLEARHPGMIQYGKINYKNEFEPKDFYLWED